MVGYCLNHMSICFWFMFSVFSWQGTARGWKILHYTSSETYHVAHFVNCRLHATLYSTLLIYSVKAYFKRKQHCVDLSKFIGLQPTLALLKWERDVGGFLLLHKGGRIKEVTGLFLFSYLEDNFCFLRPFDLFVWGVVWNLHVLFYFLTKSCVPLRIFSVCTHISRILFCIGKICVASDRDRYQCSHPIRTVFFPCFTTYAIGFKCQFFLRILTVHFYFTFVYSSSTQTSNEHSWKLMKTRINLTILPDPLPLFNNVSDRD